MHVGANLLLMFFTSTKDALASFKRNRFIKKHLQKCQERMKEVDKEKHRKAVRDFILRQKDDHVDELNQVISEIETDLESEMNQELRINIVQSFNRCRPLSAIAEVSEQDDLE